MSPVGSFWVVSHVQVGPATYWRLVLEGHRRVQDLSWGHLKPLLNLIIFNSNSSNFLLPLLWRHLYFWYSPLFTSWYSSGARRLEVSTRNSLSTWFFFKVCFSMTVIVSGSHGANQRSLDTSEDGEAWFWGIFISYLAAYAGQLHAPSFWGKFQIIR